MKGWQKGLIIGLFVCYAVSFLLVGLDTKGWSKCGFFGSQKCTAFDVIIKGPILAMGTFFYITIPILVLSITIGKKKQNKKIFNWIFKKDKNEPKH